MVNTQPLAGAEFGWKLYVRDAHGYRQGQISQYASASLKPVYNDVGAWSITVDRRSDQASALITPGWGIEAVRNGVVLLSGPANYRQHVVDATQNPPVNQVTVSGLTDEVWLKRRQARPEPATSAPPYSTSQFDTQTGTASTVLTHYVNVNAGPGALPARQVAGLAMAADPGIGSSVSASARFDNLLSLCQTLALSGKVGFRVTSDGQGHLVFSVYANNDRSGAVKFSLALGNLSRASYDSTAPVSTYATVLGSGTGTAQTVYEQPDSYAESVWGRFEGDVTQSGSSTTQQQLAQAATDELAQNSEQATLSITPIERAGCLLGVDYNLGDKVSIQLEGPVASPYTPFTGDPALIQDLVRTVDISLTAQTGGGLQQTVTTGVGTPNTKQVNRSFALLKRLTQRVNYLERR